MGEKKTKIVLDADVINHFVRGGKLSLLPKIFPEFQYIVLDVVKKELPMLILSELIKQISHGIDIREELFNVSGEAKKEYFRLTATNGLHLGLHGVLQISQRCCRQQQHQRYNQLL